MKSFRYFSFFFLISIVIVPLESHSAWKFRAREHFDFHQIQFGDESAPYRGLSNTINFWYERPFDSAFGLSFGPLLGSANNSNPNSSTFGQKITLYHWGLEYKKYLLRGFFTRPSLGWSYLNSSGSENSRDGFYAYLGAGYEFKISSIGLALEIAARHSWLARDVSALSITPSLGLHFYDF